MDGPAVAPLPLVAAIVVAVLAGGCVDPAAGARGSCAAQDIGDLRCRAIVTEAQTRIPAGAAPITGAEVLVATPADRDTLRAQQLVATVRFSFLDGSASDIPVFCSPPLQRTLVCTEVEP
jgi:hypothetical protein